MTDLSGVGRVLIGAGLALAALCLLLLLAGRIPALDRLGRIPGAIAFQWGPVSVFIPIAASIVIGILLTVILNVLPRR